MLSHSHDKEDSGSKDDKSACEKLVGSNAISRQNVPIVPKAISKCSASGDIDR